MNSARTGRDDALIVGSSKNSLVCAAMLARSGPEGRVLECESVLGGRIRTDELTPFGMRRDTLSTAQPLFLLDPALAALGKPLHAAGPEYCNAGSPTGVLLTDGRHLALSNRERFDRRGWQR